MNSGKGGYVHYQNLTNGKAENKNPKSSAPENLKDLFERYGIDISGSIKKQIGEMNTVGNEKFFESLIFFFNLICQIRNADQKATEINFQDFILSPCPDERGNLFDSRKDNGKNMPKNGDDNGAYNIARKGALILRKIFDFAKKNRSCDKMKWGDLYISDVEWDDFCSKSDR